MHLQKKDYYVFFLWEYFFFSVFFDVKILVWKIHIQKNGYLYQRGFDSPFGGKCFLLPRKVGGWKVWVRFPNIIYEFYL